LQKKKGENLVFGKEKNWRWKKGKKTKEGKKQEASIFPLARNSQQDNQNLTKARLSKILPAVAAFFF